jgi:hypothetical protein
MRYRNHHRPRAKMPTPSAPMAMAWFQRAFQPHAFSVLLAARKPPLVVVLVAIMPPA